MDKTLWMRCIGSLKYLPTMFGHGLGLAVVDHRWGHEPQCTVMMIVVVPAEECTGPIACVLDRTKALWVIRTVLHRLELGFGVGIVIRDIGTRMSLGHRARVPRQPTPGRPAGIAQVPQEVKFSQNNRNLAVLLLDKSEKLLYDANNLAMQSN